MEVNRVMGFGKFLLGGLCVVGSVVAAPVMLPSAGFALIGAAGTGAIGTAVTSAGLSLAAASTTALAGAGAVGGIAVAAGVSSAIDNAKAEGRISGYNAASKTFEDKFQKQEEEFLKQIKKFQNDTQQLILLYEMEIEQLKAELDYYKKNNSENTLFIQNKLQARQGEYQNLINPKRA